MSRHSNADLATRAVPHRRLPHLEALLTRLNDALAPAGDRLAAGHTAPRRPIVFVVGAPRSGSTLFMQWLSESGAFAVPSNLVSRFHRAPAVGAMVERLLFDPSLDFRGELALESTTGRFESSLGKTRGPREPNEFWYFWRRFFPFGDRACLEPDELERVDGAVLASELAAWEAEVERPLAMKALLMDWHLPWLARALPTAVFVDVVRDPFHTMQSLLAARREYCGDERGWYSIKPPQYRHLASLEPVDQVAGQLAAIREAVDEGLSRIEPDRIVRVDYAAFCRDPASTWGLLSAALVAAGHHMPALPPVVGSFRARDTVRVAPERERSMRDAWSRTVAASTASEL